MSECTRLELTTHAVDDISDFVAAGGDERGRPRVAWQYEQSPAGPAVVMVAQPDEESQSRFAAMYAMVPYRMTGATNCRLAQSLDTLTAPDHRGRGLFPILAKAAYARGAEEGLLGVFGFPNGHSVSGFTKHLNWRLLDPVPFMFRPLGTQYFLRALGNGQLRIPNVSIPVGPLHSRGLQFVPIHEFDEHHEALWRRMVASSIGAAVDRSAEYMNWRFVDKPGNQYRRIAVMRQGEVRALAVWVAEEKHGGRIGYVMELLVDPHDPRAGRTLLRYVLRAMRSDQCDLALAWSFDHSPNHAVFRREFFRSIPESRRPIELHFGAATFNDDPSSPWLDRSQWYVSYADSDTV